MVNKDNKRRTVSQQEQKIRDLINEPRKQHDLIKDLGLWSQLCACLDVIGDTELAIASYRAKKPDADMGTRYLAVYGLLQALFLQQDALFNLCKSLSISDSINNYPKLKEIRETRNMTIGHPTKLNRNKKISYHFISRITLNMKGFTLLSNDDTGQQIISNISISELIAEQSKYASLILESIINMLEQEEKSHKEQFKMEKLASIFQTSTYYFEKVSDGINKEEKLELGAVNFQMIKKLLETFQSSLKKRGIELDTYDAVKYAYDLLTYPMQRLETMFQLMQKGEKPNIDKETAYIFIFFVKEHIKQLEDFAEEIDKEYAS